MKFRTEIEISPFENKIGYQTSILTIGSCFAGAMGKRLEEAKFDTTINPFGVMFNPLSIAASISRLIECRTIQESELSQSNGVWFHYDFHGSLAATTPEEAVEKINHAIVEGHRSIQKSNFIIITLGTAWIYELCESGCVVANCHKQPASLFARRAMSVNEIIDALCGVVEKLHDKTILFTVSPIRHIADGLQQNSLSKSTLLVAVNHIVEKFSNVFYFPAYEILIDDLRDYRFYASDMVHPSDQAVDYIWEQFRKSLFSSQTEVQLSKVEAIIKACNHRPMNPKSVKYREFVEVQLRKMDELSGVDFSKERAVMQKIISEI